MAGRLLLLVPTTSYRIGDFLAAAERMSVAVTVGSDRDDVLASAANGGTLKIDLTDLAAAVASITAFNDEHPLSAIVAVDEETTLIAAEAAATLGLPHNDPDAVRTAGNKHRFRTRLANSGLLVPRFTLVPAAEDPARAAWESFYPAVLKPLSMAGGRGVIRADDPAAFEAAFHRITGLLDSAGATGAAAAHVLIEEFIPGAEVAVEGLLNDGNLTVLALFDKPDPLDGPYFEETSYVTPSRLDAGAQDAVAEAVAGAVNAVGLRDGPIHAEARINDHGVWIIEVAARSIGGLCARSLRFDGGLQLEDLILHHALGMPIASQEREEAASGVMMIPIPAAGVLERIEGVEDARSVEHVDDVTISIAIGGTLVPLPDGNRYLGFIFARGGDPATVETALRDAHGRLNFTIRRDQTP